MADFVKGTIENYINCLASGDATPGGGSAAALAGAKAAALMLMYARLTIGRKKYAEVEQKMKDAEAELERAKERLLQLSDLDADAFVDVMEAYRLPKSTDEEKTVRAAAVDSAIVQAAKIPLETATWAVRILEVGRKIYKDGNPSGLTDASVGVSMAMACFSGAALNVYVNVQSINDPAFCTAASKTVFDLETKARAISTEMGAYIFRELDVSAK